MKKKVLYYYMIGNVGGGSDNSLYLHLLHLNKQNYKPYVIYKKDSYLINKLREHEITTIRQTFLANENSSKEIIKKIKIPGLKTIIHNVRIIYEIVLLLKLIFKLKIDIVHLNHNIKNDRAAALAGILSRRKVISHDRGLVKIYNFDLFLIKKIDKIICISKYVKEQYDVLKVNQDKCLIVYNGIDINSYNDSFNKKTENLCIGYIGRLEQWKGVDVFIKAIPQILDSHKNIQFTIVGDGAQLESLKELAKKLDVFNSITFPGKTNKMSDVYTSLDILIHTSVKPEPFGRVIIEGMANRLPVISTNIGGPMEIISDSIDGFLIQSGDSKLLANKIITLIQDKDLRIKIGNNALTKVKSKFNVKITTQNIEKIYDSVL